MLRYENPFQTLFRLTRNLFALMMQGFHNYDYAGLLIIIERDQE